MESNKTFGHSLIIKKYLNLPQPTEKIIATYIWIDGSGENLRYKIRIIDSVQKNPSDLPIWNSDGSSTGQAQGHNSDIFLRPVSIFQDPFFPGNNILVLCDVYNSDNEPNRTNHRHSCLKVMQEAHGNHPWFGIEQEYTILDSDNHPYGWPKNGRPGPQGPYYCGVGTNRAFGRHVVEAHLKACLFAGLKICGTNGEVMPSQWEFQIGPCEGIEISDQIWIARFILYKIAEDFGVVISLNPKIMVGHWNGSGAHVNYSTEYMRAPGGIKYIEEAIEKMSKKHALHLMAYDPNSGEDNKRRLTGEFETSSLSEFTFGIANRGVSVRIPRQVEEDGCGYLEDRRPASNCDPYMVTERIIKTTLLED